MSDFLSGLYPDALKPPKSRFYDPTAPATPAGYQPPSTPASEPIPAAYQPPGSVTAPNIPASPTSPNLTRDIYAPQLNDVTQKLNAAYQAPRPGLARQIFGGIVTGMNPRNPIGGLISGETQRQQTIQPLTQQEDLLSKIIQANRAQALGDAELSNKAASTDYLKSHSDYLNRMANVKENPADKEPTSEVGLFLKDPAAAQRFEDMRASNRPDPKGPNTAESLRQQIDAANAKGDTASVKALQKRLKDVDPMGENRLAVTIQGQTNAQQRAEENVSRKDVTAHDKAYVQPAEAVEKSYQMMDHAYQEYKQAKAQGKDLPTGAQSMLALSSHLATTFGNVKGARVTKDMIEHHLGARSIPDSALVAFQKLTNGDVLSPAQWDAFHDLIGQSRKLSWQTAVKEADRKKIPKDFLPEDLSGLQGSGSQGAASTNAKDPLGIL